MSRIRVQLPEHFSFSTEIPIRITDLNYGNHVSNDSVLSLLHEARVQFLKSIGLEELKFDGTSLIMSDVAIEFKAEILYGDNITAFVAAGDFTAVSFVLYYKLMKNINTVAVAARTGMVCFDYSTSKVTRIPATAMQKLNG